MKYNFPSLSMFFHVSAGGGDDLEVYEITLKADGFTIAPHRHQHTEEFFYIIAGELLFHLDGKEFILKQGESYYVKRGMVHGFKAIHDKDAVILCCCHNAGRMEKYVSTMEHLMATKTMTREAMLALTKECDQERVNGVHEYISSREDS